MESLAQRSRSACAACRSSVFIYNWQNSLILTHFKLLALFLQNEPGNSDHAHLRSRIAEEDVIFKV